MGYCYISGINQLIKAPRPEVVVSGSRCWSPAIQMDIWPVRVPSGAVGLSHMWVSWTAVSTGPRFPRDFFLAPISRPSLPGKMCHSPCPLFLPRGSSMRKIFSFLWAVQHGCDKMSLALSTAMKENIPQEYGLAPPPPAPRR